MRVVPQLGGDEDFGARNATLPDGSTDGGFGAIDASCVDVAVACFQGFRDSVLLLIGILPRSKTNGRYGNGYLRGHREVGCGANYGFRLRYLAFAWYGELPF